MTRSIDLSVFISLADKLTRPLKDMERSVGAAAERMQGRLKLDIKADTRGVDRLSARMTAAGAKMRALGRDQLALSRDQLAATRQQTMGLLAEGAALGATAYGFGRMLAPAVNFEASMAKVGAVSRATDEELAALTATARKLGRDTPWSASQAAEGMQYLSMAGFKVNETVAAMPGMLDLASAGAIDLGAAADIASNILTGFGKEAADMGYVGDVLVNTFTTSNTSLQMLGETMKYVAPIAAAAAVDIEQVAAMTGKLGDAGIQGSQAGTALRAMISRLQAPPKAASDALAQLGVKTADANGNLRDMFDIMRDLDHAMAGMGTAAKGEMTSAIFGMEAASAATVLLGEAGSGALNDYAESLKEVGSAARVAAKMNDTAQGALKTLGSRMESLSIEIGNVFLPLLVETIDRIIPVIDMMTSWAETNPELVKTIGMLAAGLLGLKVAGLGLRLMFQPLIGAFWLFNGALGAGSWAVGALSTAAGRLAPALAVVRMGILAIGRAMLANPIGLAVAAIAGGAYLIYRNWDSVGPWFGRLWGNVRTYFMGFGEFINGVFTGDLGRAVGGLRQVWDGLRGFFGTLWAGIAGIFRATWNNVIKPITDKMGITDDIIRAWDTVRDALQAALSAIGGFFDAAWTGYIKPVIDGLFSVSGLGAVWEGIKGAIGAVLDWLSAKFAEVWAIISPVIDALKWARDNGSAAMNSLTGGSKGPISSGPYTGGATGPIVPPGVSIPSVTARAQGGSFTPGSLLVGERGPELRYESRGGFIAHHNALRGLADLSARVRSAGSVALGGAVPAATGAAMVMLPATAGAGQQISYQPHYNIVVNGSGLSADDLRRAIRAEMQAHDRQAQAGLRAVMYD